MINDRFDRNLWSLNGTSLSHFKPITLICSFVLHTFLCLVDEKNIPVHCGLKYLSAADKNFINLNAFLSRALFLTSIFVYTTVNCWLFNAIRYFIVRSTISFLPTALHFFVIIVCLNGETAIVMFL